MADDDSEDEEPAIVLGEGVQVEGAPLARVSARLMWGIEKSEIERREGDTTIRTPDGPRELADVLAEVDRTYFGTRQEFEDAVRAVVGRGPVPTPGADEDSADEGTGEETETAEGTDADESEESAEQNDTGEDGTDSEEESDTDVEGEDAEEEGEDAEEEGEDAEAEDVAEEDGDIEAEEDGDAEAEDVAKEDGDEG